MSTRPSRAPSISPITPALLGIGSRVFRWRASCASSGSPTMISSWPKCIWVRRASSRPRA